MNNQLPVNLHHKPKLKIFIAEGSTTMAIALNLIITVELGHMVIGNVRNCRELINHPSAGHASIILLDLHLSDESAICTARAISIKYRFSKVILMAATLEGLHLIELMEAGIKGVLLKENIFSELDTALTKVAFDQMYFPCKLKI